LRLYTGSGWKTHGPFLPSVLIPWRKRATIKKTRRFAMSKTATVRARIEPDLKDRVEQVFRQLGLTATQAITLFYKQVEQQRGLPFSVSLPNEVTQKTFEDTDAGRNLTVCKDADDMFEKLGI
jgi:DNA-damage-inducible protein J